ncbi:MAG: NAD(P)-binding domain-containing protein, partial [Gemmatimonadaceae bacterium]
IGARVAIAALLEGSAHESPVCVTLLGAGGSAAAVIVALESFAPITITVCARTPARARALSDRLGVSVTVVDNADEAVRDATLVINCTPVGLHDQSFPVAIESLSASARILDLIPKSGDTAWVQAARAAGHTAEDGTRMVVEQGAAAFERWFDMVPDRASMWRALKPRAEAPPTPRWTASQTGNRS